MIVRLWQGLVLAGQADAYVDFMRARAIPDYRRIAGNLSVQLLCRCDGPVAHVGTLTHWASWEAIRAFAGDDVERAKYYPEDDRFLLGRDRFVRHYEVAAGATA